MCSTGTEQELIQHGCDEGTNPTKAQYGCCSTGTYDCGVALSSEDVDRHGANLRKSFAAIIAQPNEGFAAAAKPSHDANSNHQQQLVKAGRF